MQTQRVVIVGGGFGGVATARRLRELLSPTACEVVVFNRENHMVFHPLLPEVAGASINADAVAAPLRQFLRDVHCRTESVTAIDLEQRLVEFEAHDGRLGRLSYDHLVIACGRAVNLNAVPGMSDHAFALKTVGDAMAIRARVIQQLEAAEASADTDARRQALSFVVVGGGFSGAEIAGEINDLLRNSRSFYPHVADEEIAVTLVHSGPQILPEVSSPLRDFARRKMEQSGIRIVLGARAAAATRDGIWLKDGTHVSGATIVCTIGTAPHLLIERLTADKDKGALLTEPDMRLRGQDRAWAVGDCARIHNAADGQASPTTAQFAERQGRQVAENIVHTMKGRATRPFSHRPLGQLCAIGGRNAVADVRGFRASGVFAWIVWRTVYLMKLPSWSRRVKVGADWAWQLIFRRELSSVRPDVTERVSHACFRSGDYVFRQGDAAQNFYAVEKGTLEVMRTPETGGAPEIVAVLGPGDFFGEMALIEGRPRSASVRARSDAEVTTLGAQVFTRLSKSLAPLQERLVESMRRRSTNVWGRLPHAHAVLRRTAVSEFLDGAPATLGGDRSLGDALELFATRHLDVVYIVDARQQLIGVLTRSDLHRAVDAVVTSAASNPGGMPVRGFMTADPVSAAQDDTAAAAGALMWSRGLKNLPVVVNADDRRVRGYVRMETLMQAVARAPRMPVAVAS